jgi:hypothetical protein
MAPGDSGLSEAVVTRVIRGNVSRECSGEARGRQMRLRRRNNPKLWLTPNPIMGQSQTINALVSVFGPKYGLSNQAPD